MPLVELPAVVRPSIITPPMPAARPDSAYRYIVWRLTLMPARRAASGLPPTAMVRRPNVVRLSRIQPATATSAKIQTSVGIPMRSPRKKSRKPWTVTTWVCRLAMISARPRAATSMARVAMKATTLP